MIPGARGCTPQACTFRDHHGELGALGATVYGLSTQDTAYKAEMAARLHLPFAVLSDARFELTDALGLPTFTVDGMRLLQRLTLLIRGSRVEEVLHPVPHPERSAAVPLSRGGPLVRAAVGHWDGRPGADPCRRSPGRAGGGNGPARRGLTHAGRLFTSYGTMNQGFHVFLTTGFTAGVAAPEAEEQDLIARAFPLAEVGATVRDGVVADSVTVAALGLLRLKGLL